MDVSTFTWELSTSHVEKTSHTYMLVAHMGAITMSLRKEATKKSNHSFKWLTLSDECINFCLWTTTNVHEFLAQSLHTCYKMSNESYLKRLMHITKECKAKRKHVLNERKWIDTKENIASPFHVAPLRALSPKRHLSSPL